MKSFGFLILFVIISFALSIEEGMECTRTKDGKLECCWENLNTCCDPPKEDEECGDAITTCCKIYDDKKNLK